MGIDSTAKEIEDIAFRLLTYPYHRPDALRHDSLCHDLVKVHLIEVQEERRFLKGTKMTAKRVSVSVLTVAALVMQCQAAETKGNVWANLDVQMYGFIKVDAS